MKKILSIVLIFTMLFALTLPSYANTETIKEQLESFENNLIKILNESNKQQVDSVLQEYCEQNSEFINDFVSSKSNLLKNSKTYILNDGRHVTIHDNLLISIGDIEEVFDEVVNSELEIQTLATMSSTSTYIASHTWYGQLGFKLFKVNSKGWFEYDGSTVIPHRIDCWVDKYALSFWQVTDWEEGTRNTSSKGEVYGQGHFYYGFILFGNEYYFDDVHGSVVLTCDVNGNIGGYYTSN